MRRAAALLALVALVAPPTSALAHARAELVTDNLTTAGLDSTTTGHEGSVLWTQKDPLGFAAGDTSLYVYGLGDPVSYVDPSGEICFIPLIFLIIKAVDFAMNAWDTYKLIQRLMDPCISDNDKLAELALLAAQWAGGAVLGSLLSKLQKAKFLAKFGCFAAGTLVATSTGLVPIESIEPGAIVQSRNDSTGETEWRTVTANHVRPDVPTLALGIEDEREGSWLLTTTAEHPIYVESVGYVPAGRLEPGQWLVTESGAPSRVVSVAATGATQAVYNLTVEETENYFVGPSPVLVHNIDLRCSGTSKPWTTGATPSSVYTHIDPLTGKAVQNAIYDSQGKVIGHVDFKNHGPGASSGHGHSFPEPGNPGSGHGKGNPHIPNDQLPAGWGDLPSGILPRTPIGG